MVSLQLMYLGKVAMGAQYPQVHRYCIFQQNPAGKPSLNEDDRFTEDCSSAADRHPQGTLQTDAVNKDTMGKAMCMSHVSRRMVHRPIPSKH